VELAWPQPEPKAFNACNFPLVLHI